MSLKTDVVALRTVGESYAVKLNTKSYAASIIDKMFETESKTFSELPEIKGRDRVLSSNFCCTFRKRCRGDGSHGSDIDLFIVTDHREKVEEIVARLQMDISEKFGNTVSAYYISREEFGKKQKEQLSLPVVES